MASPEKPLDVEMGDMDETNRLNPGGDVEIGGGKEVTEQRFTGLKKEELLEISSQKKWVVARWILFILFWAAWVGMLVGAIIIVIKAPRCKAEPTPPWYQDTIVYQADVRKFAGNLEGMTEHVDYVKSIKAKTLTICHANDPQDLAKVIGNANGNFTALVAASHDESDDDENMMVVVDLRIDALSTSSGTFSESAKAECSGASPSGEACSMFLWQPNGTVPADGKWIYHAGRGEYYKVTESDDSTAYVNFADEFALEYVKTVVKAWIANEADGFQLRDMSIVGSGNASKIVEAVQMAINESQADVAADKKKVIGLFLLGSNSSTLGSLYPEGNDTDSAAVVINTALSEAATALDIKNAIASWREDTEPFIGAYAVNTMDMTPLAERLGPEKAAGLTLFSYSLPGVPVVRSGDEALLAEDNFTWNTNTGTKPQTPNNASSTNAETIGSVASLRVDKHRALGSLRWDNEDATFEFVGTNDTKVIAIRRKWDTKPAVLAIYNPSDDDLVVKVTMKEGDKGGEVLASSGPIAEEKEYESFDAVSIKSGHSLLFQVAAKK